MEGGKKTYSRAALQRDCPLYYCTNVGQHSRGSVCSTEGVSEYPEPQRSSTSSEGSSILSEGKLTLDDPERAECGHEPHSL